MKAPDDFIDRHYEESRDWSTTILGCVSFPEMCRLLDQAEAYWMESEFG